jgi:3-oxoacyl-[acyl-carrier protein] reductase
VDLKSVKALVTGGGTGIGKATAKALVARGGRVAIAGRRKDVLERSAKEIGATPIVADVTKEEDVVRLVQSAIRELGGYNVLINNAGAGAFAPLVNTTAADMRRIWEINVLGATLVARESARHFVAQHGGVIVNVSSTSSQRPGPSGSAYASSKFALAGLTEVWRSELRKDNIRVMQINPSEVLTPFGEAAGRPPRTHDDPNKLRGDDIAAVIVDLVGLDDRILVTNTTVWATNPGS